MQYETPLYVVPTSKARTSLRERPRYGSLEGMLWAQQVAVRVERRSATLEPRTPAAGHMEGLGRPK